MVTATSRMTQTGHQRFQLMSQRISELQMWFYAAAKHQGFTHFNCLRRNPFVKQKGCIFNDLVTDLARLIASVK